MGLVRNILWIDFVAQFSVSQSRLLLRCRKCLRYRLLLLLEARQGHENGQGSPVGWVPLVGGAANLHGGPEHHIFLYSAPLYKV